MYKKQAERTWNIIGLCFGILLIVIGIVIISIYPGSSTNTGYTSYQYGADFYTDIYKKVASIGSHLVHIIHNIKLVSVALGLGFISFGIFDIICFGKKLAIANAIAKDEALNNQNNNVNSHNNSLSAPSTPVPVCVAQNAPTEE